MAGYNLLTFSILW